MSGKVLIVDDDRAIAQLTAIWLSAAGYGVVVALDGGTGLAKAASESPDVILLDVRMPGMDGFEVNRRLRSDRSLASIPVIFLSAHVQEAAREQALLAGGVAFLAKPYETEEVLAAVKQAAGGSEAVRGRVNR